MFGGRQLQRGGARNLLPAVVGFRERNGTAEPGRRILFSRAGSVTGTDLQPARSSYALPVEGDKPAGFRG